MKKLEENKLIKGYVASLDFLKGRNEFSALIKKILSVPHVKRTNTNVVLNVVKDPFSFIEV